MVEFHIDCPARTADGTTCDGTIVLPEGVTRAFAAPSRGVTTGTGTCDACGHRIPVTPATVDDARRVPAP